MKTWPDYIAQVRFDQPWELPVIHVIYSIEDLNLQNERYVFTDFDLSPGLGNEMFQYASILAAALDHNAKVIMPMRCSLRRAFDLDAVFVTSEVANSLLGIYGPQTRAEAQAAIKKVFTFLPGIRELAKKEFDSAMAERKKHLQTTASITTVGVHIRHGVDIVKISSNYNHGHATADRKYFLHAMNYFRKKYGTVLFIVASDDMKWAKENLFSNETGEIHFLPSKYREVDFATLAMCQHTIASTGTFSWWISYITGGEVTYYARWPREKSVLSTYVNKTDFFPPNWIPMV
uniref:L-Fucosyltransferase n=1 Tax=Syphacia muris TaxID=451379 RepID=A0A0N5A9S8_9BILA